MTWLFLPPLPEKGTPVDMATQGQPASWADEVEAEGLRGSTHGSLSWIRCAPSSILGRSPFLILVRLAFWGVSQLVFRCILDCSGVLHRRCECGGRSAASWIRTRTYRGTKRLPVLL